MGALGKAGAPLSEAPARIAALDVGAAPVIDASGACTRKSASERLSKSSRLVFLAAGLGRPSLSDGSHDSTDCGRAPGDISIAHEDAKFGFTEVRIGVAPAVISVVCLPKLRTADARATFLRGKPTVIDGKLAW